MPTILVVTLCFSPRVPRIEQNRTEQNRTEQNRTEQNRTGQDRTGQDRTGRNRTEQNRTEQNRTEQKRTEHNTTQHNRTERNRTEQNKQRNRTEQNRTEQNRINSISICFQTVWLPCTIQYFRLYFARDHVPPNFYGIVVGCFVGRTWKNNNTCYTEPPKLLFILYNTYIIYKSAGHGLETRFLDTSLLGTH